MQEATCMKLLYEGPLIWYMWQRNAVTARRTQYDHREHVLALIHSYMSSVVHGFRRPQAKSWLLPAMVRLGLIKLSLHSKFLSSSCGTI